MPQLALPDPRFRGLPEHHVADACQRQHHGQDVGLGQAIGQNAARSGDAPQAANDAASLTALKIKPLPNYPLDHT